MASDYESSQRVYMNFNFMSRSSLFMPCEMVWRGWARHALSLICRQPVNVSGPLVSNLWPLRIHGWLGLGAGSESAQWCVLGFREG